MTQKATRDVTDFVIRPIEYDGAINEGGIIVDGSADPGGLCSGSRFSIDAVPIGQTAPCNGKFIDLEATNDLNVGNDATITNDLTVNGTGSITGGTLNMNNNRIVQLADAVAAQDALNQQTGDFRYVNVGGDAMTGDLDMGGNFIENPADPVAGNQIGDRDYNDGRYVLETGDTMSGVLNMGGFQISGLGNALAGGDAVSRNFGDGRYLNDTGDTMTGTLTMSGATIAMGGNRITGLGTPSAGTDAATKAYADSVGFAGSWFTGIALGAGVPRPNPSPTKAMLVFIQSGAGLSDPWSISIQVPAGGPVVYRRDFDSVGVGTSTIEHHTAIAVVPGGSSYNYNVGFSSGSIITIDEFR